MFVGAALLLAGALCLAPPLSAAGTAPFVLDGNRVYVELSFVRPNGGIHRALAFVDMGSPAMDVAASLFRDLVLDQGRALSFRIGDLLVNVPAREVTADPSEPHAMGSDLKVEATLPASVLEKYEVVLDYRNRTLTLAPAGAIQPEGAPVPFRVNAQTGLIAVDARIDGKSYPVTIDNGSAYTWFRQDTVLKWVSKHPDWKRGVGAVGASNMMMSGDGAEASGVLLRIPEVRIGPVKLEHVGALGVGRGRSPVENLDLLDWYSTKNPVPVIGWIGGNVLKNFRLTIDYRDRTMYWLRQDEADAADQTQVGVTLRRQAGEFIVAAIATRDGKPTVEGIEVEDKLIRVDGLETRGATLGRIAEALHGKPGDVRVLVLERGSDQVSVRATVTAF